MSFRRTPVSGVALLAFLVVGLVACSSYSPDGPLMAAVLDEETHAPVPGVYVVGLFGSMGGVHGTRFDCQAAELTQSDAMGRYRFDQALKPWTLYGYKPGYWMVRRGGVMPARFTMTTRDPGPEAFAQRPGLVAKSNTPLRRRLDLSDEIFQECSRPGRVTMVSLRPLHLAMLREALASDDHELIADMCRRVANEGDSTVRPHLRQAHYVYTGVEKRRLEVSEPRCLSPALLVAEMRRVQKVDGKGLGPSRESDAEILDRAIVADSAAYTAKLARLRVPGADCVQRSVSGQAFNCYTPYGLSEYPHRAAVLEERLRIEGIAFEVDRSKNVIRFHSKDFARLAHIYGEETADL
jgi:hypothetical protein